MATLQSATLLPSAMVTALSKVGKLKPFSASFPALPSAEALTLGKDFFLKKIKDLLSAGKGALGKEFPKTN
jgi:hypothetical protein